MTKRYAIAAVAAVLTMLAGTLLFVVFGKKGDLFAECRNSMIVGESAIGGPFTLVDGSGRTLSDKEVIANPSLIYFGYTFCPDVCPLDVLRNAEAVDALDERGYDVTPVFVSVDPMRDTPEEVGDFAANMHPKMIGLTGTSEQVKKAANAYKVFYRQHESDDDFYLVDHTTFTYLVLPEQGFVEYFRRKETSGEMATRTACFLDAVA